MSSTVARIPDLGALPSRRSQVIDTLRTAVISGDLDTGVIYSAPALATQFGVSATPVREAMMQLASEGLIEVVRNKGFRIVELTGRDLQETFELRMLLEPATVAKVSAAGVAAADAKRLSKLADATIKTAKAGDFSGHIAADIAFHVALLALGGNQQLVAIVRALRSRARLFGLTSPRKAKDLLATSREHAELVELVAAGDAAAAEELMRAHIAHVREAWTRAAS